MRSLLPFLCVLSLLPLSAEARRDGVATTHCNSCHSGAQQPEVTITLDPPAPAPGDVVVVRVSIEAVNGEAGGMYLRSNGPGRFTLRDGQSTRLLSEDEVVHATPRHAVGGLVTFLVDWHVPTTPGGVRLEAMVVSANGNDSSSGDGSARTALEFVYGCAGKTFYADFDGDGFGSSKSGTLLHCTLQPGYSAGDTDCNDAHDQIYPDAEELCNGRDDDCDGSIDEGLSPQTYFRDQDGDGFGSRAFGTLQACALPTGYTTDERDCDDGSEFISPSAHEYCNGQDDDCDGEVDESGKTVACGLGACMRTSNTCDACVPGLWSQEVCNGIDDDCDGSVDESTKDCGEGTVCREGACVSPDAGPKEGKDGGAGAPAPSGCSSTGGSLASVGALLLLLLHRRALRRREVSATQASSNVSLNTL